ncbi:arabinofuranosyltransferase [Micromonospora sp. NPDC093277]|uniref:arabinofuranosyltransferase n=1 Tax=Micromonospora sp. NPDC093277 TaxID=3364291 RepID=UPI003821B217
MTASVDAETSPEQGGSSPTSSKGPEPTGVAEPPSGPADAEPGDATTDATVSTDESSDPTTSTVGHETSGAADVAPAEAGERAADEIAPVAVGAAGVTVGDGKPGGVVPETARRAWTGPVWRVLSSASLWAVLAWVVGYPVGAVVVKLIDANPFNARAAVLPAAFGVVGGAVVLALALWRSSKLVVGLAAGGYAAWVGTTLIASYNGSPFGDSGLRGDSARLAAMATKFTVHSTPVDGIVSSVPSEYPPLFPYLISRAALYLDQPAWSLMGYAEATTLSLAVLVGFLLWRGVVPAPVALALAVLPTWVFTQPRKSYEIITLAIFVPWVLRSFTDRSPRDGGLRFWSAGLIGGLILQVYQGYLMFALVGLIGLVGLVLWRSRNRLRYLAHLLGVGVVAFLVASWYLVPYLRATLEIGGDRVNDYFVSPSIAEDPLGAWFLLNPLASPLYLLQLLGLVGLVWYARKTWWALPMLLLMVGAYVYRWVFVLVFIKNGHTLYLHYTTRLIGLLLVAGAVLSAAELIPVLAGRLRVAGSTRRLEVVLVSLLMVTAAVAGIGTWMPNPPGLKTVRRPADADLNYNLAVYTHAEPMPDGSKVRYPAPSPVTVNWFPAEPVRKLVADTLGENARPVTLSYDERMFSYQPWPGYIAVERLASGTWTHWDERYAELVRLTTITDPEEFAAATANTRFGGIDVFVLRRRPMGWMFGEVKFSSKQFDLKYWKVDDTLANGTVVVVRKPTS